MLELVSPLPPHECLKRLKAEVDPQWKLLGSRPVLGTVSGSQFTGYKRIPYRNSFRTFIFARFHQAGAGSRIVIRFGMSPFVTAFMALWFGMLALVGGGMFLGATSAYLRGGAPPETWAFLVSPLIMAAFGIGLVRFGRWLGRNERSFLAEFLRTKLQAAEARGTPDVRS